MAKKAVGGGKSAAKRKIEIKNSMKMLQKQSERKNVKRNDKHIYGNQWSIEKRFRSSEP